MDRAHLQKIDDQIEALFRMVKSHLDVRQANEVYGLIDGGEYGIALEHLTTYLVAGGRPLSSEALYLIEQLAREMGLEEDEAVCTLCAKKVSPKPQM